MTRVGRVLETVARVLSVVLKLVGVGAIIFAIPAAFHVARMCTTERFDDCTEYSQLYVVYLLAASLLPVMVGIFALGASFLLDVWVAVRQNNRMVKSLQKLIQDRFAGW